VTGAFLRTVLLLSSLARLAHSEQWIESWAPDPARWFISTRVDVGYAFIRPRAAFGYGKPHVQWAGADFIPLLSTSSGGGYTGLRWTERIFEVRGGLLYLQNFSRSSLVPQSSYDRRDIDLRTGSNAEYAALDTEGKVSLPLGPIKMRYEVQLFVVHMWVDDRLVFVDPIAVVMGEGAAVRQRLSIDFPVANTSGLTLGPAVEPVWIESRPNEPWVIRAGASARFRLFDDLEIRSDLLPVVSSPDVLGRAASHFLEIKLRWRWATH